MDGRRVDVQRGRDIGMPMLFHGNGTQGALKCVVCALYTTRTIKRIEKGRTHHDT